MKVNEIKYESRDMTLETKCPAGFNQMVGSVVCWACKYNCSSNVKSRVVLCSWQKEEEDKMDLKSIAVRFENVEQREEIEAIFKKEGYGVYVVNDQFRFPQGHLGVSEVDNVVYNLTHYNRKEKIISYEEFVGGNMKRLDIGKDYEDDKIKIITLNDYSFVRLLLNKNSTTYEPLDLRIGKNHLTLDQANKIRKVLGINYFLYESVHWGEIEENTRVLVLDKNGIWDGYNGKFLKYIPDIKKVIVRVGDEVKVVDEYKVELCD